MMDQKELLNVIENHRHWLTQDCTDWEKMRADLSGADLRGADFHRANLHEADLSGADLRGANLHEADLSGADLRGADFHRANLHEADLSFADLSGADLGGADLSGANLHCADLNGANLSNADLRGADLGGADLSGVNLRGSDPSNTIIQVPLACPDTGAFVGWKKAYINTDFSKVPCIVKLLIPENARRSSAATPKCRCDTAVVLEIQDIYGFDLPKTEIAVSMYDSEFKYRVGETVSVDNFDECRWNECSSGIHFFVDRNEAVDYC